MGSEGQSDLSYLLLIGGALLMAAIVLSMVTGTVSSPDFGSSIECRSYLSESACEADPRCSPVYKEGSFFYCDAGQPSSGT